MTELLGENNEYGIITENDEDALYEGVKKMVLQSSVLSYYSKKSLERGKNFSAKKTVTAVEKMLESL